MTTGAGGKGGKDYKLKTLSSYKKRFKRLASGKFRRLKSGLSHMNRKKTSKRKRNLRQPTILGEGLSKIMRKLNFR